MPPAVAAQCIRPFPGGNPSKFDGSVRDGMTLLDYFAVHSDQPGVSEIVAMAGHKTDGFRVYIDGSDTGPTFNEWWNDLPLDKRFKLSADVRFAMARAMLTARQENSNGH